MQVLKINPVLAQIGPLTIHWYGLMYAVAFLAGYVWLYYSRPGKNLTTTSGHPLTSAQKDVLAVSVILGVLIGGRLGYILFYNPGFYLSNPAKILAVWEGGMSFHGGLIGVFLALIWLTRKYRISFLKMADFVTGIAPVGLLLGRIGNFINGELFGRIANGPFASQMCVYFPGDPANCRYPSQLFEALLEGVVLFWLLAGVRRRTQRSGAVTAMFLLFYGIFRFLVEFYREPDPQIGYVLGFFTEGQIFSTLMMIGGAMLLWRVMKQRAPK